MAVGSACVARPLGAKVKLASNHASFYKYLVFTELERLKAVVHKMEVAFQCLCVSAQTRQTISISLVQQYFITVTTAVG